MLAWVIMTSPVAASESVFMARTKVLKKKVTSVFSIARFTITSEDLPGKLSDRLRISRNIAAIDLLGQGKKAD